ncbi:MAG: hypothetical protein A3K03_03625 [Bdellovibrionales bacterium RIFOXYD1_FULL_44_7]|nr:MAG: hypothetical protein A3K03_03625 [Bdellovibrionales bacterium RIFOXYD1_FULL_44_7]
MFLKKMMAVSVISLAAGLLAVSEARVTSKTLSKSINKTQTEQKLGPHGGYLINDKENEFEVKLNQESQLIDVYALNIETEPPRNMTVTLFSDLDTAQSVEVSAVDYKGARPIPHYQGRLSTENDSYIAIGITFRISLKDLA